MADKQKYNFLTALLRQVKEAGRDGDELYEEWCALRDGGLRETANDEFERRLSEVVTGLDDLRVWVDALETRMEDMESSIGDEPGEEGDGPDDGLDDEDHRRDEPRMGGERRESRRLPENLGGASERPVAGRSMKRLVPSVS